MNRRNDVVSADTVDDAFNRVLLAEQEAQNEISDCRRQALAILRQARKHSRAISERADRRIRRVHALSDAAIQRELERIALESRGLSERPHMTPQLQADTDAAIEQLIREILL